MQSLAAGAVVPVAKHRRTADVQLRIVREGIGAGDSIAAALVLDGSEKTEASMLVASFSLKVSFAA